MLNKLGFFSLIQMTEEETTNSYTVMNGMGRGNRVFVLFALLFGFFCLFVWFFFTVLSSTRSRWHPAKLQVTDSEEPKMVVLHRMYG